MLPSSLRNDHDLSRCKVGLRTRLGVGCSQARHLLLQMNMAPETITYCLEGLALLPKLFPVQQWSCNVVSQFALYSECADHTFTATRCTCSSTCHLLFACYLWFPTPFCTQFRVCCLASSGEPCPACPAVAALCPCLSCCVQVLFATGPYTSTTMYALM